MPGGKVADIQKSVVEAEPHPMHLSLREEPIGDSALIEDLDGARVQTAAARSDKVLAGAPLDDGNVDTRQRQLGRQHQTRRTSSSNHYRMLGHRASHFPKFPVDSLLQPTMMGHEPGLAASPPARNNLKWEGE